MLETGIKVIDLICPFLKGGKIGAFGAVSYTHLEFQLNLVPVRDALKSAAEDSKKLRKTVETLDVITSDVTGPEPAADSRIGGTL